MKLNQLELNGLRQMIIKSSSKVLYKYKNQILRKNYDYLFIGDSIIEYFNLTKYLPSILAINRGVAGATTEFILNNIDTITGNVQPKEVFISIGSNDLVLLESTIEGTYLGIIEVLNLLTNKFPDARINYISTTPVVSTTNILYKKIYIGGRTNEELRSINNRVMKYSKDNVINYIHVFDELLDDTGYLNSDFTIDGIHLNAKGYDVYSKIIKSNIDKSKKF